MITGDQNKQNLALKRAKILKVEFENQIVTLKQKKKNILNKQQAELDDMTIDEIE